jgi:4-hydroxybutyrate CoA-transferase
MDWKKIYRERLLTADEAVRSVKSGFRVAVGNCAGEPLRLTEALVRNRELYRNVEITMMLSLGGCEFAAPGMEPHFTHISQFVGPSVRDAVREGRADYVPCFFSRIPFQFDSDLRPDVAMICVSPPDRHGFCSLGASVDYGKRAAEAAPVVIAQVNSHMPRTHGDSFIHVSAITHIVEHDEPLPEARRAVITDVERAIGENCASLIRDGDCLQLGIGAIPDATLMSLVGKRGLGIHTEMLSDGVVDLYEAGVITNMAKNFHRGKMVATFMMGTRKLYDFADDNPRVEMHPVTYVNDPIVASRNDNLVSINSCVQADLMGQVCAEMVGYSQISAVGGQVDFVRAAFHSRGGRSIIAMPSTAKGGTVSKIVPLLDEGACVTTSRNDVEYVITEYGIACLRYKTVRERARELIRIAHPDFRESLKESFGRRFGVRF